MNQLRIYFDHTWRDATSTNTWALCNEAGEIQQTGHTASSGLPEADEYVAIIAADRVTSLTVQAPQKSRRRWEAALPLIAEEYCLSEPEHIHVVPSPAQPDGVRDLTVVDKAWLGAIVATCNAAKRPLSRAIPEIFLPEIKPDAWVMTWDGQSGFVRTGKSSGFALDIGNVQDPPLSLQLALKNLAPKTIEVRPPANAEQFELPQWNDCPATLELGRAWDWRSSRISEQTVNLLWGEFAPRIKIREWVPRIKPPLYLLCAALMLEALAGNIEWWRLAHEKRFLSAQMERSFRNSFGEESTVVNPALQMARKLAELHHAAGLPDDSDFLPILDSLAPAFSTLPAGSLRNLRYEAGRVDADLNLPSAEAVRSLQLRLQQAGLNIRMGETHTGSSGTDVRISMQRGDTP